MDVLCERLEVLSLNVLKLERFQQQNVDLVACLIHQYLRRSRDVCGFCFDNHVIVTVSIAYCFKI